MLQVESGLPDEVIAERGYRTVESSAELGRFGFATRQARAPGLLIPLHDVHGVLRVHLFRPDDPRILQERVVKYEYPRGTPLILDVPPRCRPALLDPRIELWITEGEKKADALAAQGLCGINLNGVWAWRGKHRSDGKAALPDWDAIALNEREIVLAFDSDIVEKRSVVQALQRLGRYLELRGAA